MYKKIISIILMVTMMSLSAQVAVGDLQVLKTNNIETKMELVNYLVLEGYSEEEATNLISELSEEQIEDVKTEIDKARKGGKGIQVLDFIGGVVGAALLIYMWACIICLLTN